MAVMAWSHSAPNSNIQQQLQFIIMKEHQAKKNCQTFMNKLQNTNVYDHIKELLLRWKKVDNKQDVSAAIDTFVKISKVVHGIGQEEKDEKLIQYFNRCLVKEAIVPKKIVANQSLEDAVCKNPQATKIIQNVQQWVNKQTKIVEKVVPKPPVPPIQQIKDNALLGRLESHPKYKQISKIILLYLKSIITFDEIRNLLTPAFLTDPSLISNIIQTSQEIIQKRRKATIFASLNELVDKKYPNLQRVGESYILIPQGYANYSKAWQTNPQEQIMNRKCVSVPLGSEVSFIINKKTDYEEQLFSYEDQRYQIDNALCSLKAVITILSSNQQSPRKMESPLLQRIINQLYPNQNVGSIFIKNPELARNVLLPRVIQKREQLIACRQKFIKTCQDVAVKNFYKSLDYRCFYFAKNDKKFNCPARWQKEVEMRRVQIIQNKDPVQQQQIEDRQSLQRGRFFYVNSFANITKQNLIQNQQVVGGFDRKIHSGYPKYPDNQILFILNFADEEILNDVLEVILFYCNRKNLLQLLIFKLMRTDIKKRLKKSPLLAHLIDTKEKIVNNNQIYQIFSNLSNQEYVTALEQQGYPMGDEVLLNENKNFSKNFKDSQQEFMQMIQEDEQPVQIEAQKSPFEGPQNGFTLIGTKQFYIFLRFVTAIYQRFLKAKEYSQQFSSTLINNQEGMQENKMKVDMYKFFLTVIYKIKDKKYFQENMRKIFCKNAFIFFTLEKMIFSTVKVINNIAADSLSFQIIKDQTKDYELGAVDWEKFCFPSITMQLTRLYLENQTLFRFTYEPTQKNFYISAWDPPFKQNLAVKEKSNQLVERFEEYTTKVGKFTKEKEKPKQKRQSVSEQIYRGQEICKGLGRLLLKGQILFLNKQREKEKETKSITQKYTKLEINKLKRLKKRYS